MLRIPCFKMLTSFLQSLICLWKKAGGQASTCLSQTHSRTYHLPAKAKHFRDCTLKRGRIHFYHVTQGLQDQSPWKKSSPFSTSRVYISGFWILIIFHPGYQWVRRSQSNLISLCVVHGGSAMKLSLKKTWRDIRKFPLRLTRSHGTDCLTTMTSKSYQTNRRACLRMPALHFKKTPLLTVVTHLNILLNA